MRWLLALMLVWGCDGETRPDGGMRDTGFDVAVDTGPPLVVAAPMIPWRGEGPPVAMPTFVCASGWTARDVDGATVCEPYPSGVESCGLGEMHVPGTAGCAPVGAACPTGTFPADLPTDDSVVFVDRAAGAGGDGTRASPLDRLSAVDWGSLPAGTTVAIARGTYPGFLPLRAGVTARGACAAETIITGQVGQSAVAAPITGGAAAEVRDLSIDSPPSFGVLSQGRGGLLRVSGVHIRGAQDVGAVVTAGGELELLGVRVQGTRPSATGQFGVGLQAEAATRTEVRDSVFDENVQLGMRVLGAGTTLTIDNVRIDRTRPSPAGTSGSGIFVRETATLDATRLVVQEGRQAGLILDGVGTSATLQQVVIRDVAFAAEIRAGHGVMAQSGASVSGAQLFFEGLPSAGLYIVASTAPDLSDVVVRGGTHGLMVLSGGDAVIERFDVAGTRELGLRVVGAGSQATVADAAIHDTDIGDTEDVVLGQGVSVEDRATATLDRVAVTNTFGASLIADSMASLVLRDALVQGTSRSGGFGRGVSIQRGATAELDRVVLRDTELLGVYASGDETRLDARDLVVEATGRGVMSTDTAGMGVIIARGAALTAERLEIREAIIGGLVTFGSATVDVRELQVDGVAPRCAGCEATDYGFGVVSADSVVSVDTFRIADAFLCGVIIQGAGVELNLTAGLVRGSQIGACVQSEGFDVAQLLSDVEYLDNGTNLDTTSLPLPDFEADF